MIEVKVDARGFLESWESMANDIDAFGFNAWVRAMQTAEESMHEYNYQNRTGALTASMRTVPSRGGRFAWAGAVEARAPHARYVNDGAQPHEISARRPGGMLRFYWAKIGAWVALPRVWHPGTHPAGFVTKAQRTFLDTAPGTVQTAVDKAIRNSE